jgi:hypothetical protein
MYQTTCFIGEKEYPLDFTKQSTRDCYIFKGHLFHDQVVEFTFNTNLEMSSFTAQFIPNDIPFTFKNAIQTAIKEHDSSGDETKWIE